MEVPPKRIEWIDCAKAIGLLLMIFAHSLGSNFPVPYSPLIFAIYSFHMPLFFIASGLTMKFSDCQEHFFITAMKSFFSLFFPMAATYFLFEFTRHFSNIGFHVPFFLIFILVVYKEYVSEEYSKGKLNAKLFVIILISCCYFLLIVRDILNYNLISIKYIAEQFNTLLWSFLVGKVHIGGLYAYGVGSLWFLPALLFGRIIFDYLNLKIKNVAKFIWMVCLLGIFGIILGKFQYLLPFDLDISLVMLPFLYIGISLKEFYKKTDYLDKIQIFFICLLLWALAVVTEYHIDTKHLDLAMRHYPLFPIFYTVTLSGTLCVFYLSRQLVKLQISKFLTFVGRNSLYIYLIHHLDQELKWYNFVKIKDCFLTNGILEILLDILIFLFLSKVISDKYTFLQKLTLFVCTVSFCEELSVYVKAILM